MGICKSKGQNSLKIISDQHSSNKIQKAQQQEKLDIANQQPTITASKNHIYITKSKSMFDLSVLKPGQNDFLSEKFENYFKSFSYSVSTQSKKTIGTISLKDLQQIIFMEIIEIIKITQIRIYFTTLLLEITIDALMAAKIKQYLRDFFM
ncbi:hypothetical protein pb186bvf_007803 [Paramecium bursaria]